MVDRTIFQLVFMKILLVDRTGDEYDDIVNYEDV